MGLAHVACLVRQGQIETEGDFATFDGWMRCKLCGQQFHGEVRLALTWASWKTYRALPEDSWTRITALNRIGVAMNSCSQHAEALPHMETSLRLLQRYHKSTHAHQVVAFASALAGCYCALERYEDELRVTRVCFDTDVKMHGRTSEQAFFSADRLAHALRHNERGTEAIALLREQVPLAKRTMSAEHRTSLAMNYHLAGMLHDEALSLPDPARHVQLSLARAMLEDVVRISRRVFGPSHPHYMMFAETLTRMQ